MSRFLSLATDWLEALKQARIEHSRDRKLGSKISSSRDDRVRKTILAFEPVEDRVLLSTAPVHPFAAAAGAAIEHRSLAAKVEHGIDAKSATAAAVHALRVSRSVSVVTGVSGYALPGDEATLSATVTSKGVGVEGVTVRFQLRGRIVGQAATDSNGVATLSGVSTGGLAVGSYRLAAAFRGNAAYTRAIGRGTLSVGAVPPVITSVSGTGAFGGTGTLVASLGFQSAPISGQTLQFTINGKAVGQAVTNSLGVATLGNVSMTGYNAGPHTGIIGVSYAGSANFNSSTGTGDLTLTRGQAGITIGNLSQTYNGAAKAVTVTTTPANLTYSISYTNASGVVSSTPAAAGTYTVNVIVNDANYAGTSTATLVIAKAQLTVTGITVTSTAYNGTTVATLATGGATLVGAAANDPVGIVTTGAAGTFDTKNVGTNKTVTISGLTLGGISAGNYTLVQPTATGTITAAQLTVNGVTAANRAYNGTTAATVNASSATLSGVISGDTVSLVTTGAAGTFENKNVGAGKVVNVSGLTLSGADASNYAVVQPAITGTITAAQLTVNGITASNKVYDGTTTATINTSSATLSGVIGSESVTLVSTNAIGTFADANVGAGKTVTITGLTLSGADASNYAIAPTTTTANITPAQLTVSGVTVGSKVYDGTTAITPDVTNAALVGVVSGDTVTLDKTGAAGNFDTKNAGIGKTATITGLTLTGASASNYTLATVTATGDITKASLTVSGITTTAKTYDGTTTANADYSGATLGGVVSGDTVTLDSSGATADYDTKNVGTGKTVTIAGLVLGGADGGNYVLTTPVTTTGDITAATLTVNGITASDKTFDGTTNATIDTANASLAGVIGSDDVTLNTGSAVGTFQNAGPGNNIPVDITGLTIGGADNGNYVLDQPTTSANITP